MVLHLTSCICLGPVSPPAFIPPSISAKGSQGDLAMRVLEIIRKHRVIYLNSLTKKTQFISAETRNEILLALIDGGKVKVNTIYNVGAGRPSRRYSVA